MPKIMRGIALAAILTTSLSAGAAWAHAGSGSVEDARLMNPGISANVLFVGEFSRDIDSADANGSRLQEAELQLVSEVDRYWNADVIFAFAPGVGGEDDEAGVEQAVLVNRSLPAGLGLRLGKFFLPFGKHAPLHGHDFAFVNAPAPVRAFLGDDGPTDVGAELVWTPPLPWHSELTVYGIDGRNDIMDSESRDMGCGARLSNEWRIGGGGEMELGFSGLTGPVASGEDLLGDIDGRLDMYGADLSYNWASRTGEQGPALSATCEFLLPDPEGAEGDPWGLYGILQYRFHRNWWLGLGAGTVNDSWRTIAADGGDYGDRLRDYREYKANLTLASDELWSLRAEISYLEDAAGDYEDLRVAAQWSFTIGAHSHDHH